jgi:glycosyltransferase involved in cell wall biosynthesis
MNCSIVVPVYRGTKTLPALISRLEPVLARLADQYEVILVNDCSPDDSWQVITHLVKTYPWVRGINLMRNFGQHNATLCGVRAARFEIVITMDDDLQHPPEEIHSLLSELDKGYDVVYGAPRQLPQGFFRNLLTKLTKILLARIMGVPSIRNISAFRAFRASLKNAFTNFSGPTLTLDVLLSWGTTRFTSVPVSIEAAEDRSNYSFFMLVRVALLILTGYSTAPLRFASWLGFGMTLFGVGVFLYVTIIYFAEGSLPGFPFLASIVSIFGGAQLFALGIVGEYMAHMFERIMDRPTYVISDQIGSEKE